MTANQPRLKGRAPAVRGERQSSPPSQRWWRHRLVLQQLQSRLLKDRQEQASEAFEKIEGKPATPSETATDEFAHNMSFALLANEEELLQEVDAALSRIANGTYGVCEESGRRIPRVRLMAIPWTRYTKEVAERLERQEARSQPRMAPLVSTKSRAPSGMALVEEHDELALQEEPEVPHQGNCDDVEIEEVSAEDALTFEGNQTDRSD